MTKRFITIEGVEGAGKSTAINTIAQWLESRDQQVICTREPGGTPLGEELRSVLLGHRSDGMSAEAEVLLMFAARAEHLARVIRPALDRGAWVVCDRFTDASIAYQGGGRGLGIERIEALAAWAHPDITPGLTLWLDVPVTLGLERAAGRSQPDRFESEHARFFEAVRAAYAQIAKRHPERVKRIDASRPIEQVEQDIRHCLDAYD